MAINVYNTMTRKKEEFVPMHEGKVGIYVCGVTPYNHPHIGNARPFVTWDVIRRFLEHEGYDVLHVQNFTDVDDKIINTANQEGVQWSDISGRYIEAYFKAMDALNVRRAHIYPRVSEHIKDIIGTVERLIENGHAYQADGDVFYSVQSFPRYGCLSGRDLTDQISGARVDVDERKKDPMDFALWKAAKPGEPAWDSPWGKGRPGWHIECSTMSMKYLGEQFDLHGGGSDLIFPHHENEIAQSEGATGKHPFVKYWLHNGFITVNSEKMSKSLGNFFTVKDILEHFEPEVLRFFIISTHYRSPLDFSDERLTEAKAALARLKSAKANLDDLRKIPGKGPNDETLAARDAALKVRSDFMAAMEDDFNTALAISHMFTLAKEINVFAAKVKDGSIPADGKTIAVFASIFAECAQILGVLEEDEKKAAAGGLEDRLVQYLLDMRQEARKAKDFAKADAIRDDLGKMGVIVEDTPQGARWKKN